MGQLFATKSAKSAKNAKKFGLFAALFLIVFFSGCIDQNGTKFAEYKDDIITVEEYYVDNLNPTENSLSTISFLVQNNGDQKEGVDVEVYFYDLGIRNSLVENFNNLEIRSDTGALWENFCIVERKKFNEAESRFVNSYFWRTYDQKEIDYIEEAGGKIAGFEFRWSDKKSYKPPADFIQKYEADVERIDRGNYWKFLGL